MGIKLIKSLLVAAFGLFTLLFSVQVKAQHEAHKTEVNGPAAEGHKKGFNAKDVIFGHILDNHEYHFTEYHDAEGKAHHISLPLPILLYSPQRGFSAFMSSAFHHGEAAHKGYKLVEDKIVAVDAAGAVDSTVKVYDFSMTRNVVQMLLALTLLTWLFISIANSYKKGLGVKSAPKGKQGLLEPVITFIRDEVAKPNLGHKYEKYLPYLLTVFFFILINNIFGLIPGTANVTGNIAFTVVLGVISFVVTMASSNKHYWAHIFNPPGVPFLVKFILVPVEVMSMFLKPFSLIIRLFANMVAGHIIIICLISLIFIFGEKMGAVAGWVASPLSIAFTIFIYFIEVLVAFLQAFIFTTLTAVLIGSAIEGDHAHEGHAVAAH
jgi:F-type H+-transporting ATPase subunit a